MSFPNAILSYTFDILNISTPGTILTPSGTSYTDSNGHTSTETYAEKQEQLNRMNNSFKNTPAFKAGQQLGGEGGPIVPIDTPGGYDTFAYLLAFNLTDSLFKISIARVKNCKFIPKYDDNNNVINFYFETTINNVYNSATAQPNDNLSAVCLANWFAKFAETQNDNEPCPKCIDPPVPPFDYISSATCLSDFNTSMKDKTALNLPLANCSEHFTENFFSLNKILEHASNVTTTAVPAPPGETIPAPPGSQLTQNRSGATAPAGTIIRTSSTNNSPMKYLDYIFQYSYPISFIGAIFFCIAQIVVIDPSSILINKNISIVVNIIIFLSGLYSLFRWFNTDIPFAESTYVTSQNIRISN
jgi:hypothetical protein